MPKIHEEREHAWNTNLRETAEPPQIACRLLRGVRPDLSSICYHFSVAVLLGSPVAHRPFS